jgi:hypothetical protein
MNKRRCRALRDQTHDSLVQPLHLRGSGRERPVVWRSNANASGAGGRGDRLSGPSPGWSCPRDFPRIGEARRACDAKHRIGGEFGWPGAGEFNQCEVSWKFGATLPEDCGAIRLGRWLVVWHQASGAVSMVRKARIGARTRESRVLRLYAGRGSQRPTVPMRVGRSRDSSSAGSQRPRSMTPAIFLVLPMSSSGFASSSTRSAR